MASNIPSSKEQDRELWSASMFQNVLSKSKLKPHTFFEGYGSIVDAFANDESSKVKTWSRKVVTHLLQKFACYFPQKRHENSPNPPSLVQAWAYYEHVTLPRRYVGEGVADEALHRAEPGEQAETELYDPFFTPQSALIEWGTGVDLYFISLRFFAIILFIAGLINIKSIHYYESEDYNGVGANQTELLLRGSAVCTNTAWVVCTDCTSAQWRFDKSRFATAADGTTLVLRNLCRGAAMVNGIASFSTLIFLLVSFFVFSYYLRRREIRFDEDKVTTTDYSIVVHNPPKDALNPDEWSDFFEQFTPDNDQVTVVTIALNNQELLRKLIKRRVQRRKLRLMFTEAVDLDNDIAVRLGIERFNMEIADENMGLLGKLFAQSPEKLVDKITLLTEEIRELQKHRYDVTKVFVTFETEVAQRAALKALTVGNIDLWRNNTSTVSPEHVFEDILLKVREPCEPNAVRWLDLSTGRIVSLKGRMLTLGLTCGILGLASLGITSARSTVGPSLSGPLTSISNTLIPNIIKMMMALESHSTEGGYQTSLYLKVTLFRWMLAAVLAQIITPFTSTVSQDKTDLLPTISHILFADLWIVPMMKLLDIGGNVKKHLLGPRAKTQEEMNMYFQGSHYNLGERYTDMTKVLFVVFFYSALFPAGFFFGALILTIQYFVDKFSLMRLWGWSPLIGSELAVFSRRYFFTAALIALALVSSFAWAEFPYDNLCENPATRRRLNKKYSGVSTLKDVLVNGNGIVHVNQASSVTYCSQSWRATRGVALPQFPQITYENDSWSFAVEERDTPWMTPSQVWLTTIYGWIAAAIILVFASVILLKLFRRVVLSSFTNTYKPDGDSQHIDFSSDPDIFAYVPQIKTKGFPFPFLACYVDTIDHGLIGWGDGDRGYDDNNLLLDVPRFGIGSEKSDSDPDGESEPLLTASEGALTHNPGRPIYSVMKHYPTKWQIELSAKNKFGLGKKSQ